jgi:hypothetical protein
MLTEIGSSIYIIVRVGLGGYAAGVCGNVNDSGGDGEDWSSKQSDRGGV